MPWLRVLFIGSTLSGCCFILGSQLHTPRIIFKSCFTITASNAGMQAAEMMQCGMSFTLADALMPCVKSRYLRQCYNYE